MKNYWKAAFWVLGIIPLGFILSILSFYFHASWELGHLPHYNYPDPKQLTIYNVHAPFIDPAIELWFVSFLAWILLVPIYLLMRRKNRMWKPIAWSALSQFIAVLILLSEVFAWYVD